MNFENDKPSTCGTITESLIRKVPQCKTLPSRSVPSVITASASRTYLCGRKRRSPINDVRSGGVSSATSKQRPHPQFEASTHRVGSRPLDRNTLCVLKFSSPAWFRIYSPPACTYLQPAGICVFTARRHLRIYSPSASAYLPLASVRMVFPPVFFFRHLYRISYIKPRLLRRGCCQVCAGRSHHLGWIL